MLCAHHPSLAGRFVWGTVARGTTEVGALNRDRKPQRYPQDAADQDRDASLSGLSEADPT